METRIIRKLLYQSLNIRCITTDSKSIQRIFNLNPNQHRYHLRNISKWSPNIVKSPVMNAPIPEGTLVESIWSRINQWPEKIALVCGITGREIKYNELQDTSKKVASSFLSTLGIYPGQVIATILPNIPEHVSVILGAFEAGIIVSPINPLFTSDEIAIQLKTSGAVGAVTLPTKLPALLEATSKLDLPDFKIIVTPNIDGSTEEDLPNNLIHYSSLVSNQVDHEKLNLLKPKTVSPDDTVVIPFSSGTTGIPKGVCLTNKNLLANNASMRYVKYVYDTTSNYQDVIPMVLPIFHVYGLTIVLTSSLYCGAKVILLPKFEETTFLKALKDYQSTVLYVAPPIVLYLGNSPSVTKEHLSTLRLTVSGAAPLAESDVMKFINKAPPNMVFTQGFGLSETSPIVSSIPEHIKPPNLNTVGIPVPNTQIKVSDLQTGQALGASEEGEILVKGPQVMKGYLNNPEATKECIDDNGWFHTGDVGYYDENGFFYITDRLKELIKVKGFQVAPSELEAVLRSHTDVLDAGVIGVPDPRDGEVPIAFIQTNVKDEKSLEQLLRKYIAKKLAKHKHVVKFFFVENIPKSASGKILRKDLKKLYLNITEK